MTVCVLVGIPGSGKSTIGRELAKKLGVDFCDTDRVIESEAGKSVASIFVEDGEAQFRKMESRVVLESLSKENAVISLGGGSILDSDVRAALANHNVIWLKTSVGNAVRRTSINQNRPLLLEAPRATLIRLMDERDPLYLEVSKYSIDTDEKSIKVIVQEISDVLARKNTNDSN
jgi:shikimate kinase